MNYKPRFLGILRVEDEVNVPPPSESLPVMNLGRIGRWTSFVRGLSRGGVIVKQDHLEDQDSVLAEIPEILSIDFRFIFDDSTPGFSFAQSSFGWSDKLNAKNTGILIGATLEGMFKENDLPLLVVLHTLTPADVGQDVATVLLVGQILAGSGALQFNDDHPFDTVRGALYELPKNCEKAVIRGMRIFRKELLRRLGIFGEPCPARLMVDPDDLAHLLSVLDACSTEEGLDKCLEEVGLTLWDRESKVHVLDLRSLFLDFLGAGDCERPWGRLQLEHVKNKPEESEWEESVLGYLEKIVQTVGSDFAEAADHVRRNLNTAAEPFPFPRGDRAGKKLLSLVFACAEEWTRLGIELSTKLESPWEAAPDCCDESERCPSLREILKSLVSALAEMDSNLRPSTLAADKFYPVQCAKGASILKGILCYIKEHKDEEHIYSRTLQRTLYDRPTQDDPQQWRVRTVCRLMGYLEQLGMVQREERSGVPYFRLVRMRLPEGSHVIAAELSRDRVARLLGFTPSGESVTNELRRIAKAAGYQRSAEFVNAVLRGQVPGHLRRAARWYLERRASDLPVEFWPNWCT